MWDTILDFIKNNYKYVIEGYLVFIISVVLYRFAAKNKKTRKLLVVYLFILLGWLISYLLKYKVSETLYRYIALIYPIGTTIILSDDIKKRLDNLTKTEAKTSILSSSQKTRDEIADACMYLSSRKIGALITIEKHNSLDQYAQKAIQLDSDISKELLINIFTPLTPLHDGGVIIRGNKIRCAGAYYVLTQHGETLDKTTGSRHRAGLGISEVSDSLTIICSEETGNISIAIEGILIKINDRDKLIEYIDLFLK